MHRYPKYNGSHIFNKYATLRGTTAHANPRDMCKMIATTCLGEMGEIPVCECCKMRCARWMYETEIVATEPDYFTEAMTSPFTPTIDSESDEDMPIVNLFAN